MESGGCQLESRTIMDAHEPAWSVERPIKDFGADWPVYERMTLVPPEELDWRPVQEALDSVGEDYLLEVYVGCPFVDYAGGPREGGLEQVILDLYDRETEMEALQERYIENVVGKIRAAFANTSSRSVFIGSGWSSMSLLSPAIWEQWERPVLEAAVRAAHGCGGLVHHHFHGRCMPVLEELVELAVDCICPFERPPGGDVTDLQVVRRVLRGRVTFNGNVHTVETLIRGTPQDVQNQVLEILEAFSGSPRLIIGTGDQVGVETADENIHAMVETARRYGRRTAAPE
jgi:uroporphyrinogen-III decarboxylase